MGGGGATILVIEHNPITRQMVCACLVGAGFRVVEAETGHDALAEMSRAGVDLVLQDLVLPDIDGHELRARLVELAGERAPPILAMTGLDDEARIIAAGFSDVLAKPMHPARLLASVRAYLGRRESPALVGAGRRVLLVDDEPVQLRLTSVMLGNHDFQVTAVRSGEEALALPGPPADVVISDILMPGMDGLELCRRLRRDRRYAQAPIVLVSSQQLTPEDREWGRRAGATAIVSRTQDFKPLLEVVVQALADGPGPLPAPARGAGLHEAAARLELRADLREATLRLERIVLGAQRVLGRLHHLSLGESDLDLLVMEQLASLLDVLGFTVGAAYVLDERGDLAARASFGLAAGRARELLAGGEPVLRGWLDAEDPLLIARAEAGAEPALLAIAGVRSAVAVPLRAGGERLGLLFLGSLNDSLPDGALGLAKLLQGAISHTLLLARTLTRLSAAEQRFHNIAEATADALIVTDATARVRYANLAARQLLGGPGAPLEERPVGELLPFLASGARQGTVTSPSGSTVPVEVAARSFDDATGQANVVYAVRDLSQRLQLEEFTHLANHDLLTGLLNRRRFEEELASRLAEARRFGTHGALLVIDIDHFKQINDTLGHAAGDRMLREVGAAIRGMTRDCDAPARLGGDELIVLLTHADADAACMYARRLRERLAQVHTDGLGPLRVSVGVALFPRHGDRPDTLFAAADRALYQAKRLGRDACCVFDERA
jgi:diguanylate cyclase (GGDEF)-like protein